MHAKTFFLCGESGSGKTTLCRRVISTLQPRGMDFAGILSPPHFDADVKTAIGVQNVRTGEQRVLAKYVGADAGTLNLKWRFDPENLQWGAEILRAAMPCQVLVIDELGPLELIHHKGWTIALDQLRTRNYQHALVVIRPSLLPNLQLQLADLDTVVLNLTRTNQAELFTQIITQLETA